MRVVSRLCDMLTTKLHGFTSRLHDYNSWRMPGGIKFKNKSSHVPAMLT
jgi:hypothetical protein